jgi:hypothetical protein
MIMTLGGKSPIISYSVGDNWPDNGTLLFSLSVLSIHASGLKPGVFRYRQVG